MKTNIKLLTVALLALLNIQVVKAQDKEMTVKLTDPTKPAKLTIDLFCGSIKVIGYSGKEVIITADGPYAPGKGDQKPVKDNAKNIAEYVTQQSNAISFIVEKPSIMNLVVKVPKSCSLVLKVFTAGDITVDNIAGDQEISVVNGRITLSGISGSVLANNTKGNIRVALSAVQPQTAIALSSVVSAVELTAPANLKADARLQSDFENVTTDYSIAGNAKPQKTAHRLSGKIDGGGANIYLKSVGGRVALQKVK